ncbi:ABC transporter permease [Pseudomonas syringae]|jgi:peptide/nickel transport system permease protein|uniref:ABC transporter permease n=1 Tax=Pseudomonas syringae TaxID=317 RepID=A0A1C7Z0Z3_PSESX|nr:ABC transporter permease [Pseudomonas syringae]OCR22736.1 ABC transporter permease [Pseudomonas syringae]
MNSKTLSILGQRIGGLLLTLLIVSLMVFFVTSLLPGDAAQQSLGQFATPEQLTALRTQMGLEKPPLLRYLKWLTGLLNGDMGLSLSSQEPISNLIGGRLSSSLMLAGVTTLISVPMALIIGIGSAMFRGSFFDRLLNVLTMSMVAIPEFLVATLAVFFFAVKLQWLSALTFAQDVTSPLEFIRAYALPVATLCCVIVAQMARMTRAALIDQLDKPYIEMARLKGVRPVRAILAHALPNAVGPIANAIAVSLSYLIGGAVIVETIFNYPGLAKLMVDGVTNRDMPLIQACAMMFCGAYLFLLILADICAVLSNPRLRNR